ncbi:hypothetical protein DBR06_SOUSAS7910039 [Sousa chinensis]|uniref:Uncharacterized protein n=1 Tax=Sousa chinensis TaxID=103600 RepID=A0A484GZT8_SOUCH|nr:hypothetical protein DBR06_SOUSAS7910039 [Sousa chinensis]
MTALKAGGTGTRQSACLHLLRGRDRKFKKVQEGGRQKLKLLSPLSEAPQIPFHYYGLLCTIPDASLGSLLKGGWTWEGPRTLRPEVESLA